MIMESVHEGRGGEVTSVPKLTVGMSVGCENNTCG